MSTGMRVVHPPSSANMSIAAQNSQYESKPSTKKSSFHFTRTSSGSGPISILRSESSSVDRSPTSTLSSSLSTGKLPRRSASAGFFLSETGKPGVLPRLAPECSERRPLPHRTASAVFRAAESGSGVTLPDRAPEAERQQRKRRAAPSRNASAVFRAAEGGKGDLLPTTSGTDFRSRSKSVENILDWHGQADGSKNESPQRRTQSLRSRRPSRILQQEEYPADKGHSNNSVGRGHGKTMFGIRRKRYSFNKIFLDRQLTKLVQLLLAGAIALLVIDSYRRSIIATGQLSRFEREESMMFLHLDRVEQQMRNLHEQFDKVGVKELESVGAKTTKVDNELLKKQLEQLKQMEEEISHEVRSLQTNIQLAARSSIVKTYGEGPVQVVLDLDFADESTTDGTRLTILLWYDTPHASWKLLQQVEAGDWNGALFEMDKGRSIAATPSKVDSNTGGLKFVEKSARNHDPWTVGLSDFGEDGIGMFINLKDNSEYHQTDVCVGKVVDGFDALQQLVSETRRRGSTVVIKEAKASHMPRAASSTIV